MKDSGNRLGPVGGLISLLAIVGFRCVVKNDGRSSAQSGRFNTTASALAEITSTDERFLEIALAMAEDAHEEEVASGIAVEAKSGALMSALGVTATLLVAAGTLLFAGAQSIDGPRWLTVVVTLCFGGSSISLALAFRCAFQALRIGRVARPSPLTFLPLQLLGTRATNELQRERLASLLVSHDRNRRSNNEKAASLADGYIWAFWTVKVLLLAAFLLAGNTLIPTVREWRHSSGTTSVVTVGGSESSTGASLSTGGP